MQQRLMAGLAGSVKELVIVPHRVAMAMPT
jgi:hypothetical protein